MKPLDLTIFLPIAVLAGTVPAWPQGCETRDEISAAGRTVIENAAQQTFDQASRGDVNALRDSAIPSLQSSVGGVAGAINDNKAALTGAKTQLRTEFLLDTGATPPSDGRFYCGVFGAGGQGAGSAAFEIPGLPAGKYSIVIQDFIGNKRAYALTTNFQDIFGKWELAGVYVCPGTARGPEGVWDLSRAPGYKGQSHEPQ